LKNTIDTHSHTGACTLRAAMEGVKMLALQAGLDACQVLNLNSIVT